MPKTLLENTTVADFGGGWNVADSDLNLSSKFQPVSDNVLRGVNGSFTARWGTQLFADLRDGVVSTYTTEAVTSFAVIDTVAAISLTITAHGYVDGQHINIPQVTLASGALGGIGATEIAGIHCISVVDANTILFYVRTPAVGSHTGTLTMPLWYVDNHTLAGNIIHMQYFKGNMILFDDIGEIARMSDVDGTAIKMWNVQVAEMLSGAPAPTRECTHWSTTTFKSTVIACNGHDKDKPLQINDEFAVEYLVDKATSSNAAVPKADFVLGLQAFVVFVRTEYGDPFLEFSARGTDGTFTREADPADAVETDLSMITDTVEPILLGAAPFRDKMFVAFYDRGMIGTIGNYDSNTPPNHTPDFTDTISEHGTIGHRTIVPLGNDIFMADYAGVPSVSISSIGGTFIPTRLSELIAPELSKHLASLSETTLKNNAFAIFNKSDRMYMLFLPKYDEVTQNADIDPFLFNPTLKALNQALLIMPNHKLFDKSTILISGATAIGSLGADDINGLREIVRIVDTDAMIVQLGGAPASPSTVSGGGSSVAIVPVNDETFCYGFEYNKELKIRRWTRLRGWHIDCAAQTQRGRVYFAKGGKVYRYGSSEEPLHADFLKDYDERTWHTNTEYDVGIRILDGSSNTVYICQLQHTSSLFGSFSDYRFANPNVWTEYTGEAIEWALETPWSDFGMRGNQKTVKYVNHDTEGTDVFQYSMFNNQIYRDAQTYALAPSRTLQFSAGGVGGYGMADPATWGSGRRTREEKLWPMPIKGKLFKLRYDGLTRERVRIISTTMHYTKGSIR